jgi:hypothetical protein
VFAVLVFTMVSPQYIFRDFDLLTMVIEYGNFFGSAATIFDKWLETLVGYNGSDALGGGLCFFTNVWLDAPYAETTLMVMTATPMAMATTVFVSNMMTTIVKSEFLGKPVEVDDKMSTFGT